MPEPVVRIVGGQAFEVCAQLVAFTSGPARASLESGKTWIRETRRLAGRDLIDAVLRHALSTYVGLAMIGAEIGDDVALGDLINRLAAHEPERLRRRLIGADSPMYRDSLDPDDVERAASGDARARARLRAVLGESRAGRREVDRLLRSDPRALQLELVDVLAGWGERVFPRWGPEAMAAIGRDVEAKAELRSRTSARELIAAATVGLRFEPAAWVEQVVIAPSVAIRPFVVPADSESTAFFLVSVSDEAMEPEGVVPSRLVRVAAALGDPIRIRALHELAHHGGLAASALAERLGIERTSLHHHLGILRSAGLVAIGDRGDGIWRYEVRRDRIDELGGLLRSYLGDVVP